MAKRKRLTPAREDYLLTGAEPEEMVAPRPGPLAPPRLPISQIAGDAATSAALQSLSDEMARARQEGRMVVALPEDRIEADYLVRDRLVVDEAELAALMQSLQARGQQIPVEVVDLGAGRYGLISGWRRLTALRRLHAETGEARFSQVQCLLRRPETAAAAYVSMVEENELRVGLSYYERARIAARAVEGRVYDSEKAALLSLFSTASRAKRSKIRSFLPIYHALDRVLRFGSAIPERLGLMLSGAIEARPGFAAALAARLTLAPATSAAEELALLARALAEDVAAQKQALNAVSEPVLPEAAVFSTPAGEVQLRRQTLRGTSCLVLSGPGVTEEFEAALVEWLSAQG